MKLQFVLVTIVKDSFSKANHCYVRIRIQRILKIPEADFFLGMKRKLKHLLKCVENETVINLFFGNQIKTWWII